MKIQKIIFTILLGMVMVAAGCSNKNQNQKPQEKAKSSKTNIQYKMIEAKTLKLDHIHGIGYPGNDDHALYLAAHDGLKMYKDSKWFETTSNLHDYMGFQAIEKGFLASGHPQKGTDLKNPLGLVQSIDKGKTIDQLAFYGQMDFHFMAASFSGNGIYVINEEQNDKLAPGVNYSKDNGKTWKKSEFKNFNADSLGMIAVHPVNGDFMAMSTRSGIYYSQDNGNTMKLITNPVMVTALTFIGDELLYSSVENGSILLKTINPKTGSQKNWNIPFLDYDNPITYLAVNPKDKRQIAFSTYKNGVYETTDGGNNWKILLKSGKMEQD
ncbi:F510_1955 family glycosylhydrolase [Neobacillus niacini]|uniref:F510_1955 family glycosylhydrolase n=1 Tax=Neobacillus niacini TaxID=86668 RepID=UPI00286406D2|nr:hypothetical protein [Neobacillus niacini]MDR7000376.1 hypothetical protein [Neobacillus niacini]